jgi:hypothetical protein
MKDRSVRTPFSAERKRRRRTQLTNAVSVDERDFLGEYYGDVY